MRMIIIFQENKRSGLGCYTRRGKVSNGVGRHRRGASSFRGRAPWAAVRRYAFPAEFIDACVVPCVEAERGTAPVAAHVDLTATLFRADIVRKQRRLRPVPPKHQRRVLPGPLSVTPEPIDFAQDKLRDRYFVPTMPALAPTRHAPGRAPLALHTLSRPTSSRGTTGARCSGCRPRAAARSAAPGSTRSARPACGRCPGCTPDWESCSLVG